jgi:NAD(P)-dependent dehydrogenase (short-subunit alcohol dehydrogenase family)
MKIDLTGKTALVTGAARGIGRATALRLGASGARVIIADIDQQEAIRASAAVAGSMPLAMDVATESDVARAMAEVKAKVGHLDILVNNAGVNSLNHRVPIDEFPLSEWEWIMNVDLKGLFLVSRAAIPLLGGPDARIVNVASVLGLVPARLQCAYVAAKAGVVNLTRAMALELAPRGILVNGVAPGSTLTEATRHLFYGAGAAMPEKAQRLLAHVPLGRAGEADEVASAILFFASPACSYITGQILAVDGGWGAGGFLRDF